MEHVPNLIKIFSFGAIAFVASVLLTPTLTNFLYQSRLGKQIREISMDGDQTPLFRKLHIKKTGTPTMAGILIWGITALIVLLSSFTPYSIFNRGQVWLPLFTLVACAILGAIDDYFNIRQIGKNKGLPAKPKLFWLTAFATAGALWFYFKLDWHTLHIPRLGDFNIGLLYIPLFIFVIIASANAVNITDGLDGLAAGLLIIAFGSYGVIAYLKGMVILTTFCSVITGSLVSFLWFNIPPARFYMGDTGSLSLGATLGVIAMLTNSVAVLPFIGFVFVVETLSVILQRWSKRYRQRKIFYIAPLHHHFEHVGWPEYKVTMRFWILGAVMAGVGLIIGLIGMGIR